MIPLRGSAEPVYSIAARLEQMKQALEEAVRLDPTLSGMETTMTLAVNFRADLLVAHVGDSRAYLLRQGHLERLTRDSDDRAVVYGSTLVALCESDAR